MKTIKSIALAIDGMFDLVWGEEFQFPIERTTVEYPYYLGN
ncbi:hypothetical protein ACFLUJ_03980 [Chloroflexota bacterium]